MSLNRRYDTGEEQIGMGPVCQAVFLNIYACAVRRVMDCLSMAKPVVQITIRGSASTVAYYLLPVDGSLHWRWWRMSFERHCRSCLKPVRPGDKIGFLLVVNLLPTWSFVTSDKIHSVMWGQTKPCNEHPPWKRLTRGWVLGVALEDYSSTHWGK